MGSPRAFDPPSSSRVSQSVLWNVVGEEVWDDVEVRPSNPPIRRVEFRLDPLLPLMVYVFLKNGSKEIQNAINEPQLHSFHEIITLVHANVKHSTPLDTANPLDDLLNLPAQDSPTRNSISHDNFPDFLIAYQRNPFAKSVSRSQKANRGRP